MQCKLCNEKFSKDWLLKRHITQNHKQTYEDYFVEFQMNGDKPTCKCGCGEITKFNSVESKFAEYKRGHISRIHNNWGHNKKAIEKSAETRRQQYKNGEREVWNKGLTQETDKRVKDNCRNIVKWSKSVEGRKLRSYYMKKHRLDGTIPTLYGPDSSQWKGGTSSISNIIYASNKLYKEWKYPILKRDSFKCVQCQSTDELHVHHNKETLSEIITRFNSDAPDNFEIKKMIADEVIDYHIQSDVSGITLCEDCHKEKHPSLNFQ